MKEDCALSRIKSYLKLLKNLNTKNSAEYYYRNRRNHSPEVDLCKCEMIIDDM